MGFLQVVTGQKAGLLSLRDFEIDDDFPILPALHLGVRLAVGRSAVAILVEFLLFTVDQAVGLGVGHGIGQLCKLVPLFVLVWVRRSQLERDLHQ